MRKNIQQDRLIGLRLKALRNCAGITRKDLAQFLEISVQQIQKYENGANRLSVSTLLKIANFINVPIWDFIEDENGVLIDSQEQRALYYWRSLNHPKLQSEFIDLMQCVSDAQKTIEKRGQV